MRLVVAVLLIYLGLAPTHELILQTENCRRGRRVILMPPIPAAPAALPAVHPFAPPGAPLPSPSTKTPVMPRTKLPIPMEDYEGQGLILWSARFVRIIILWMGDKV